MTKQLQMTTGRSIFRAEVFTYGRIRKNEGTREDGRIELVRFGGSNKKSTKLVLRLDLPGWVLNEIGPLKDIEVVW